LTTIDSRSSALVLFSGGQDSTTCLAWALSKYQHVETIGFSYGQRHSIELRSREPIRAAIREYFPDWGDRLGTDHLVDLGALLSDRELPSREDGLPATFVPGRNIVFLTFAGIVAEQRGLKFLVTGTCETDFSGYPDCRDDTVKAVQVALNLGMQSRLAIETPLMWIDKAATWTLSHVLGGSTLVELIVEQTHTCYNGDREHRHSWGYGCGRCDACKLRQLGWLKFAAERTDLRLATA
jgi:7-cyano-7-deazaguanine synthase